MATETEMQSEIKRLSGQLFQGQQQFQMLQQGYFSVGNTFRQVVQDILLALASGDEEDLKAARANARDVVKKWDEAIKMKQKAEEQQSKIIQPELKIVTPNGDPS